MTKVLTVIGTRPEAIKMGVVVKALEARRDVFESRLCVTAQHRDMLDQVLGPWGIRPHHDLNIMRPGQSLNQVASAVLSGLDAVLDIERPDWVLVQGDTTTAATASLAAFHRGVAVGHVEAGLRTDDVGHPFPEEMNRRMTSVLATLHFAPTEWAAGNLRAEGIPNDRIFVTGNTVIDAFQRTASMSFDPAATPLGRLPMGHKRMVLVTTHRRESFGDGIVEVCSALRRLARAHDDIHLAMPVHPNPKAGRPVVDILGDVNNVTLLPPLGYQAMAWLLRNCHFIVTDSGGLQEEATAVGKPVLVLRRTTERPEGVQAGTAKLVGTSGSQLISWAERLLGDEKLYRSMSRMASPYGSGDAAARIVDILLRADQASEVTAA